MSNQWKMMAEEEYDVWIKEKTGISEFKPISQSGCDEIKRSFLTKSMICIKCKHKFIVYFDRIHFQQQNAEERYEEPNRIKYNIVCTSCDKTTHEIESYVELNIIYNEMPENFGNPWDEKDKIKVFNNFLKGYSIIKSANKMKRTVVGATSMMRNVLEPIKKMYLDQIKVIDVSKNITDKNKEAKKKYIRKCNIIKFIGYGASLEFIENLSQRIDFGKISISIINQGIELIRQKEEKTIKKKNGIAMKWLNYQESIYGIEIKNCIKGKEYLIPGTRYLADGYCEETNTIFEFYGCVYHGCQTCFPEQNKIDPSLKVTYKKLREKTERRKMKISMLGYRVITVWECDWRRELKTIDN